MLDAAAIISEAEERAGIADAEGHLFHPHLDRLVDAINAEANLTAPNQTMLRNALVGRSADRLEGLRFVRDWPEIANEAIEQPIFLTGLPRSGTTFFQYLFDRDTRFRLIRTWEAISPSPPPGFDPASVTRRKAEEGQRRRAARPDVPGFDALHLVDADGSEECHAFLEQTYAAAGFFNYLNVPSYFDYLAREVDFEPVYRTHKRQLQLLQWHMPQPRWALKYPNHVLAMDAIAAVHPQARFVMTHRDPIQTLASIANLTLKLRQARAAEPLDPHAVGLQMLDFVSRHIDRIMQFTGSEIAGRVTHVDYYRLVDHPPKVMEEVHTALGMDSPDAVRAAVADWHARNPKGARGANPYALQTFGLDTGAVAERFAPYMQRFDIPRESVGMTRRAN